MQATHLQTARSVGHSPKPADVDLQDWVGRQTKERGCVPETVARTIHATLAGSDERCPGVGDPLPALWHWYAFPPAVGMDDLAEDGHPALGGFLPPVPYERRMWASGKFEFFGDLYVDEDIEKRSTIVSVDQKTGSSGGMVFVVVEHELYGRDGLAIKESQSIVYLPIAPEFVAPPKIAGPDGDFAFDVSQKVSTALLFRYSAITFNAHRIHFDLPYAQTVEHYPGLVVHGPLQANLLMAQATKWKTRRPDSFRFRGVHPMFHDCDIQLRAQQTKTNGLEMATVAGAGHVGMTAHAEWRD